ncbi:TIGR04282 family arsenosugar biosynthesis glycosyltransferase [Vicingaceae bacterium]|nr:TIGR04282 family arsenosugar biosynthesis glycosyltransferase [Vicingaceae bacterium]MDB4061781.1 TIGR04282 family arsenosugar biosynthesis glycosyltransferase [Vicingaceae bacterium]MDC1451775.1 TIGR04282 family arsenosugar biosynthesis glycosyltransferase [Vicingaceae bacterium]
MQNHLIIFVKNAVLGTVKTRLAASIGDEKALEVYSDLMQKCQQEALKVQCKRHVFYSQSIPVKDGWAKENVEKKLQAEGDLGEKITSAFHNVFKEKGRVLIIGSDCFDLDAETIRQAFQELNSCDLVIGPANDGGYYLLGTNNFHPELFENVNWSTETVLEETIQQAKTKDLSVTLLKELIDLDTLEDLEKSGYSLR